jgi:Cu/Zn superoxide dismutase
MDEFLNDFNESQEQVVDAQETEQVETADIGTSEVVATPTETKPVQTAEENAKFAEIRRKFEAESEARAQAKADAVIAELYGETHGIYTEADYRRALAEQEAEEKGLTPEEYQALQVGMTQQQKTKQRQQDIEGIIQLSAKEGFDPTQLPSEVLIQWNNGEGGRLPEIYKEYQYKSKEKTITETISAKDKRIAELEKALGIRAGNEENAQASTGSVGNNSVKTELTEDMIANMSPKELSRRWDEVKKLTKMR